MIQKRFQNTTRLTKHFGGWNFSSCRENHTLKKPCTPLIGIFFLGGGRKEQNNLDPPKGVEFQPEIADPTGGFNLNGFYQPKWLAKGVGFLWGISPNMHQDGRSQIWVIWSIQGGLLPVINGVITCYNPYTWPSKWVFRGWNNPFKCSYGPLL